MQRVFRQGRQVMMLAAAALGAACSGSKDAASGGANDAIKVGVYGPFTGGSSPMGASMRDGARLAAEEINAKGGVLGKKIELVERDDQATPERGAQVMQDLVSNEKVVAVLGPINTGVAPLQLIAWGVAGNVNGVVITSPRMPSARTAASRAIVPLLKSDTSFTSRYC